MIFLHKIEGATLASAPWSGDPDAFEAALWIDLVDPTAVEEAEVERALGVELPVRSPEPDLERPALSPLAGVLVLAHGIRQGRPERAEALILLAKGRLVSVSFGGMPLWQALHMQLPAGAARTSPEELLGLLLNGTAASAAETIDHVAGELRQIAGDLFVDRTGRVRPRRADAKLQIILRRLGRKAMALGILRESLRSIDAMCALIRPHLADRGQVFLVQTLKQAERRVRSLLAHEAQLTAEIGYLQDATMGLINLAQTRVIKAFSIAAVLFLPPSLVAAVYGMNFRAMPELAWAYGYTFALALMAISAALPLWWFRRQGWL